MWECENHADKADRQVTVDDITNESHKTITQMNPTTESHGIGHKCDDITNKNGNHK